MTGQVTLQLGSVQLWRPPTLYAELTGSRNTYTSGSCGTVLESTDLLYKVYIGHFCTLAESQAIQEDIESQLALAPNLTLIRQDTPDALLFRNRVKKGTLDLSSDQADLRLRFGSNRTIVLNLTLTVVPINSASGGGDATFRHAKVLGASGAFNWTANTIKALLFDGTSTAPEELYAQTLVDFVHLGEITTTGYARQTIGGKAVSEGSVVQLLLTDPSFTISSGGLEVTGAVIFEDNGSDATSNPLFLISPPPFTPDGSLKIVHVDLTGLW